MIVKNEINVNLEFKIHSIELIEKSFRLPQIIDGKIPDIQFELAINLSIDQVNKRIVDFLNVKAKSAADNSVVASITVSCSFEITNFEEVVILSENSISIPNPIIETLNIITIGTTRGIMFNEFKGTWLHNSILPVIDPKSFKQSME